MSNALLTSAKVAKKDEFYTEYADIENKLKFYSKNLENKIIYCNCDEPNKSQFVKYFILNFHKLKLKKFICTAFKEPYGLKFETDGNNFNSDNALNFYEKIIPSELNFNGDFRNEENLAILKNADIIITNPPFSLAREYFKQLLSLNKEFLVIGNMNMITYKEIFPAIKQNKMWVGANFNKSLNFTASKNYEFKNNTDTIKVPAISWFTNLKGEIPKQKLDLTKSIKQQIYQKYNNYNAINIDVVKNIPKDYFGVMGVPISFLNKYDSTQFRIIGHEHDINGNLGLGISQGQFEINGKGQYKRILIQRCDIDFTNYFQQAKQLIKENPLNLNCIFADKITPEQYAKLCFESIKNSNGKSLNLIIFENLPLENNYQIYLELCQKSLSLDKNNEILINSNYLNDKTNDILKQQFLKSKNQSNKNIKNLTLDSISTQLSLF